MSSQRASSPDILPDSPGSTNQSPNRDRSPDNQSVVSIQSDNVTVGSFAHIESIIDAYPNLVAFNLIDVDGFDVNGDDHNGDDHNGDDDDDDDENEGYYEDTDSDDGYPRFLPPLRRRNETEMSDRELRSRSAAPATPTATPAARRRPRTPQESSSALTEQIKSAEPPAKIRKVESPKSDKSEKDDDDGETCPICLDSWGTSAEHRLVSLKCGHLFGESCVRKWLKAQPIRSRTCPTCKNKVHLKDIRHIYARKLVAVDNTELTSMQKQIEQLQTEKSRIELDLENTKHSLRACSMQLDVVRSLMKSQANKEHPVRKSWRFTLEKNLEICRLGGCRVSTYNCTSYELYVSQRSSNNLFPGYGIRKINCLDYKLGQFLHLHPKPIRDITYSFTRDWLLSVGLDSTARIVERGIPSLTFKSTIPLWSCSWDYLRSNEFFVGGVGGVVQQFDVRNPSTALSTLTTPGDVSPVVSLTSTELGLLSCQLNSCWLWIGNSRKWESKLVPVEGSFTSMRYDKEDQRVLITTRPSTVERSKLILCKMRASSMHGEVFFDVEETFNGSSRSSLMSRPCWVKVPGSSWVASHSESDSALILHGLEGARTMSLPASEPALDVNCVQFNGINILASLSESRLRIYKALQT